MKEEHSKIRETFGEGAPPNNPMISKAPSIYPSFALVFKLRQNSMGLCISCGSVQHESCKAADSLSYGI